MPESNKKIERYFNKKADGFDAFYSGKENIFYKIIDILFRKSMQERFKQAMQECYNIKNKKILDIGCGSGRYSVELAKKGPLKVIGVDFSDEMLGLARELARESKVQNTCDFIKADFLKFQFTDKFDISIAIGFFDYFKYPQAALRKIRNLTQEKVIISFPVRWGLRSLIRKIRLKILGCSVYFYSKNQIRGLLKEAGFNNFKVKDLGRDYLVIAQI